MEPEDSLPHIMEPEDSLPHLQEPAICPHSELHQSGPCLHAKSWRSILTLSFHLCWAFQVVSFFRFPYQNPVCSSLLHKLAKYPAYLVLPDSITPIKFGKDYRSLSSSLCSFLHSPVTSFLLDPNILLNSLLSETLNLRSSFDVSDQLSHPYKTTGKIIVLCIFMFIFLDSKLEGRTFCTEGQQASPDFSPFLISWWIEFWFIRLVPKHMNYLESFCPPVGVEG
jgi:hypothetical protein